MKAWALCKALHNMLLKCKSKTKCLRWSGPFSAGIHTHTSAITFGLRLFPIHEYLEDCVYDCSLAILQSLSSPPHAWCWTMTVVKAAEFHEVQFWSVAITIMVTKVKVELFKQTCAETVKIRAGLLRKHSAQDGCGTRRQRQWVFPCAWCPSVWNFPFLLSL